MEKPGRQAKQWDEQLAQRLQQASPFEPAAWDAMQAKLDKTMPVSALGSVNGSAVLPQQAQKRKRRPVLWFSIAASLVGLLILAGLWWNWHHEEPEKFADQQGAVTTKVTEKPEAAPGNPAVAANEQQGGGAAHTAAKAAAGHEAPSENLSGTAGHAEPAKDAASANPAVIAGTTRQKADEKDFPAQLGAVNPIAGDLAGGQQAADLPPAAVGENISLLRAEKIPFQYSSRAVTLKAPVLPPVVLAADTAFVAAAAVVPAQKKERRHRWSIALAGTPDMSQVGSLSTTRSGWGGGLLLGYQLSSRLRLQTGAIYTKKNYQSYDSFVPYEGLGSGYYAPEYIDASCGVLDLPLNVQYRFAQGKRFRWYAATGLSSYLMLSEYYNFQYRYYNYEYEYKNDNKHWLGVLNAGVGVETPLFKRITLQAEPYFKLPLNGVGAGQIRLTSFGALLQLRYEL